MEYTIHPSDDGRYIILKVTGEITADQMMACNIETHAAGEKLGVFRYLVDVTEARNVDSVINNYQFAYRDLRGRTDMNKSARVAILADPEDASHDFAETVMRNAGVNVKLFKDRDAAISHLAD